MKIWNLLLIFALVISVQSCMQATENPDIMLNGEKLDFGNSAGSTNGPYNYGPENSLGLYSSHTFVTTDEVSNGVTVEIYASNSNGHAYCSEFNDPDYISSDPSNIQSYNGSLEYYPYGDVFEKCTVYLYSYQFDQQSHVTIKVQDSSGESSYINIMVYAKPLVAMTSNFWCDFEVEETGSLNYKCEGLGPTYNYGGSEMFMDFGNNGYPDYNPHTVKHVLSGQNHACVALSNSDIQCFGQNNYGQLGIDPFNNTENGYQNYGVVSGFASAYTGVMPTSAASGSNHTCIEISGGVYCWGNNNKGQLGANPIDGGGLCEGDTQWGTEASCDGVGTWRTYTHQHKQLFSSSIDKLSAGHEHTCFSVMDEAFCVGDNSYGQLGLRDDQANSVTSAFAEALGFTTPNGEFIDELESGWSHTCALFSVTGPENVVKCWGNNSHGQLGHDSTALTVNNGDNITGNYFDDVTTDTGEMDYIPAIDLGVVTETLYDYDVQPGYESNNCFIYNGTAEPQDYTCTEEYPREPYELFAAGNKTCVIDQFDKLTCFGDYDVQESYDVMDVLINPYSTCVIWKDGNHMCFQ